jgi:hypothetical protein
MGLYKILRIIALILALIGAAFALMVAGSDKETLMQDGSMVDNMMRIAYLVFAIVLILVLFYVIKGLFAGNIKKTLLTLGIFFAIVVVSYLMSSGTDLDLQPFIDKGQDITEATSRKVGAGLYTFYTLAVLAILSMLSSGLIKKTS